jgi:hypothetical protein
LTITRTNFSSSSCLLRHRDPELLVQGDIVVGWEPEYAGQLPGRQAQQLYKAGRHPVHRPRTISSKKADNDAWVKVCEAINRPEILLAQARKMVVKLQDNAETLDAEQDRIQKELDTLTMEWQWIITQNVIPKNDEERLEIFEFKRQVVNTLVKRVTIDRNRELQVEISLNLLNLSHDEPPPEDDSNRRGYPRRLEGKHKDKIKTAGIYPNKLDLTASVYLTVIL